MMNTLPPPYWVPAGRVLSGLCLGALAACSPGHGATPASAPAASAAPAAASAPTVAVTTVAARRGDLPQTLDLTGTVTATSVVDVRPQVTSVVLQVHVREGQFVRAGDVLFTLDSRADTANVARLTAQLAKDRATLADAQRQWQRSQELLAQNFVSQGAVDTARTQVEAAQAALASDQAAVTAARVPLAYARVTAPSAGRVGTVNAFVGSSVQANQTSLVTITRLDPIDVAFALPQRYLPNALDGLKGQATRVEAVLPDTGTRLSGTLVFVDSAVDAATGTVKVKARFDNRDHRLWPGAFVKVAATSRVLRNTVVVPAAAIVQTAAGTIVFVVKDGRADLRAVQIAAIQGADAAVTGVESGEPVVLDGRQNLRAGVPVKERAAPEGKAAAR